MALKGPVATENLDIAFRLQSKSQLFDGSNNSLFGVRANIVASSSSHGIVIVGSTNPELIVVTLKNLEIARNEEQSLPVRKIPLSSPTSQIATNCDGSILAVAVKVNGTPLIQLFSVASFLTPNIQKLREFRLSADNSDAIQLCWNPVTSATLAVCTESGVLNIHTLKEAGMEFHAIDPNLKAKCCCWSPKGKQIVVGFSNGKLMQFTPECKPAKVIECQQGIVAGSFDTIAIQWLSTFQFAVAFLSHQAESRPVLHIVNAPKGAPPQYISYNDVCYSSSESRPSKMYLQHVMPWNMILVASANSIDVSYLRISQPGDLPVWTQEFPHDQFPAELPLTPSKDESFPLGFELETGCSGRLLQEDGSPYAVMPMVHILSTYGVLCSFYLLNTTPSYVDMCSPARPLDQNALSLFKVSQPAAPTSQLLAVLQTPPKTEAAFTQPMSQSTPAISKVNPMAVKPVTGGLFSGINTSQPPPFGSSSTVPPSFSSKSFGSVSLGFGANANATSFGTLSNPPSFGASSDPPAVQMPAIPSSLTITPIVSSQPQASITAAAALPLITVPPTYTPAVQAKTETAKKASEKTNAVEDEKVYSRMIQDEMKAFELELKSVMEKSKSLRVSIGTKEESSDMRKSIEELDELKREAAETIESLRTDVQSNRLGITEMFSMVYEARAKFDQTNNEKSIFVTQNQVQDRAGKRTMDRLVKQVSQCEMQLQVAVQVMNSQWANYQEVVNKCKKNRMHNPSLEGLYQTLTKQQEIIYRQNEKMALLKTKLGLRDNAMKQKCLTSPAMESFSDSMISISLADQVESENSKLTNKKIKTLRNLLADREVVTIKPQRPEHAGLNSEIIREKKVSTLKSLKRRSTEATNVAPEVEVTTPAQFYSAPPMSVPSFSTPTMAPVLPTVHSAPTLNQSTQGFSLNMQPSQPKPNLSFGLSMSDSKPSFGLSSSSLVMGVEKKKNEAPLMFGAMSSQAPQTQGSSSFGLFGAKPTPEPPKPAATIANANVAVTASFSIPLAHKVATSMPKEPPKVLEKKNDENKPPATNENASFTFKLSEKKDESATVTLKAQPGTPNFASPFAGAGDASKGFSFASSGTAAPFNLRTKASDAKAVNSEAPVSSSASTASVFSGFGGTTPATAPSGSLFGASSSFSGFGSSGFSLNLGDTSKTPATAFSLNLSSTDKAPPATISSFSLPALSPAVVADTKPISSTSAPVKTSDASTFSFGTALSTTESDVSSTSSTFSFASTASTVASSQQTKPVDLVKLTTTTAAAFPVTTSVTSPSDSILQGLNICSPVIQNVPASPVPPSPPTNIFGGSVLGSAPKTETSSFFGNNAFGSALGTSTTPTSVFGASTVAAPTFGSTVITTSSSPSVFGGQVTPTTSTPAPLFGSLSLSPADSNKSLTTSPPTGIFSSLVKPDQSVFASTTPTTAPTSIFDGSVNSGGGNQSTNVFGTQSASLSPSTNIFGSVSSQPSPSIFGSVQTPATQASTFGSAQGSVFGQQTAGNATGGSLFSQSSFASPPTNNPFGGGQPAAASPFGASPSVFGSQQSPSQSSTSSIFGGQSSFGGQQQSSGSIFGGGSAIAAPSPFGSSSVFGGAASFSNAFGGSAFGSSTAPSAGFGQSATFGGQATFGSPKSNIFGQAASAAPANNIFAQLGSQQTGNMFGNLAQNTPQAQPPPQAGFSGSAFSSWR